MEEVNDALYRASQRSRVTWTQDENWLEAATAIDAVDDQCFVIVSHVGGETKLEAIPIKTEAESIRVYEFLKLLISYKMLIEDL